MDFEDTPDEAAFRARAHAFLDSHAKKRDGAGMIYRAGSEDPSFRNEAKAWQAKKANAGYAGITWPREWGGQGGSAIQQVIYDQEEAKYTVPSGVAWMPYGPRPSVHRRPSARRSSDRGARSSRSGR